MRWLLVLLCLFIYQLTLGQMRDTVIEVNHHQRAAQVFAIDSQNYVYPRPKAVTFVTSLPKTFDYAA